jgi:hypothetical protein
MGISNTSNRAKRRFAWRSLQFLIFSCVVLLPPVARSDEANASVGKHVDHYGLLVRIAPEHRPQAADFAHALTKDFVDGAVIVVQWSSLEPKPGVYDFSGLDEWIGKVAALHKVISLGVIAGSFTPTWLYSSPYNVPRNEFNYNRNPQSAPVCTVLVLPSPWDEHFIKEYNQMSADLAQHVRDFQAPGVARGAAYDALRIVKLGGVNNTSEELRLVANKGDNGPCHQSDARKVWADAGFTPAKIERAWQELIGNTGRVFPDKILSIAVIQAGAFPPVDDSGHIYAPAPHTLDALTTRLVDIALARFNGRLSVQWNALSQREPNPAVTDAGRKGAIVAWQLNEFLGPQGGSGCFDGEQRVRCKSIEDFEATLNNGISRGAHFIEIWAKNVDEFEPAFRRAHDRLKQQASH